MSYVFLANGFEVCETPQGCGVAIRDADALHEALARYVVTMPARMCGQELRFIRSMTDLSPNAMGRLLGVTRLMVERWERHPHRPLPGAADRLLRMVYVGKTDGLGSPLSARVLESLEDIAGVGHERVVSEHDQRWRRA